MFPRAPHPGAYASGPGGYTSRFEGGVAPDGEAVSPLVRAARESLRSVDCPVCAGYKLMDTLFCGRCRGFLPRGAFSVLATRWSKRKIGRDGGKRRAPTLIAERNDRPVGCCGLQYHGPGQAVLGFGMVAPAHQRQGIGTAQLLVRLALITPSVHGTATVAMTAVPNSLPFYRRFGFASMGNLPAADGNTYPTAILRLNSARIHACRKLLAARGITFPEVGARIPSFTVG